MRRKVTEMPAESGLGKEGPLFKAILYRIATCLASLVIFELS